jgi:hypothetical protein
MKRYILEKWRITFLKIMSTSILDILIKNGYDYNEQ